MQKSFFKIEHAFVQPPFPGRLFKFYIDYRVRLHLRMFAI